MAVEILLKVITNTNQEDMIFSIDSFVKRLLALLEYQPEYTWKMDMVLFKAESCHDELLKRIGSDDYHLSTVSFSFNILRLLGMTAENKREWYNKYLVHRVDFGIYVGFLTLCL